MICKFRWMTYDRLAWSGRADGIMPSVAALSAVTCPGQPSPQLPQAYMHPTRVNAAILWKRTV